MMVDIFGFKRRRAKRVEKYKNQYREMDREQRKGHCDLLKQTGNTQVFRDRAILERLRAAMAVEREEIPSNPSLQPCARYGYEAVGRGWEQILIDLDSKLVEILGDQHSEVKVLQIKEKFGGLRVYLQYNNLPEDKRDSIFQVVKEAEDQSFRTCEACGVEDGVKTGYSKSEKIFWLKTLCPTHHQKRREEREEQIQLREHSSDKAFPKR